MADPQTRVVPEDETFLSDEDIFEQAFNERYGPDPDAPPAGGDPDDPNPDGDPAPDHGEGFDPGAAPPAEPGAGANGGPAPQGQPAAGTPATPEWMNSLPEEAKAYLQQTSTELTNLRGQYTALHGRLAPVQQENARLRDRLATSTQAPQPGPVANPGTAPVGQPLPADFKLSDDPQFKEFQDAFPDEAKALEAVFARQSQSISYLQQQLGNVSRGLQEIQQSSSSQQRQAELARLSEAHPDWATVRPSSDFDLWLQAQPPEIAQFANSPKASHCIWILDRYKADAFLAQQFAQPGAPQGQQPSNGIGPAQQTRIRRQQIRSVPALDPQQVGVGAPNGDPGQFLSDEEIWDAEVERRLRAQREANNRR